MAGLAVLALASAGCSEPEQPSTTLPTAASTSAEPTLEPLGPADFPVPDEAREQSEAGSMAMAAYYLDLIDYYYSTLPSGAATAEWLSNLSSNCESCEYYEDLYIEWKASSYSLTGGDASIESIQAVEPVSATADLAWFVQSTASTLTDAQGSEIVEGSSPATRLSGGMYLTWDSLRSVWVADQLNLVPVP